MPHFIYLIHPLRDEFFDKPTEAEEAAMAAHFEYLKQSVEAGIVLLAGPCLDDTFGLVIFQAADDDAARAFMYQDPSVQANVMMAELHPFHLSIQGNH